MDNLTNIDDQNLDDIRRLFEHHSDAAFLMNIEGVINYANQAASNILEYSMEDLLTLNFHEIVSPESLEVFKYYFQKAAESETQEFIIGFKCKNGNRLEFKMVTISNEFEGGIVNIIGCLSEISDQKNTNSINSQASKDLCESFVENNRDPILLLDLDGIIKLANGAFSQLLGWRKENLEGFHILLCPSIPPYMIEQMRDYFNLVKKGEPDLSYLETIRISTEGVPHSVMLSITPMHDSDSKICNWAVQLRDVTEHKQ